RQLGQPGGLVERDVDLARRSADHARTVHPAPTPAGRTTRVGVDRLPGQTRSRVTVGRVASARLQPQREQTDQRVLLDIAAGAGTAPNTVVAIWQQWAARQFRHGQLPAPDRERAARQLGVTVSTAGRRSRRRPRPFPTRPGDAVPADEPRPFGQRLRQRRQQMGMTRPVLAGLVGRSAEWVKAVETGRLQQPRLPILLRIAGVLGMAALAELPGGQSVEVASLARGRPPSVTGIKAVVQRYTLVRPDRPPYPAVVLRDRVAAAWRTWHTSLDRRTQVGRLLPDLLTDCQDAAQASAGPDRRGAPPPPAGAPPPRPPGRGDPPGAQPPLADADTRG